MLRQKITVDFSRASALVRAFWLAAFITAGWGGTGCGASGSHGGTGSVSGTVTYWIGDGPAAGAVVRAGDVASTTGPDGSFLLSGVPKGSQTLSVQTSGFAESSVIVDVTRNSTVEQNLSLLPLTSTLPVGNRQQYLFGINYAWFNYATDFGTGGFGKYTNWNQVSADFADITTQGARIVRVWLFADGRYSPEFGSDGSITGLDDSVLMDVDQMLQIAADNRVYLLFTLVDSAILNGPTALGGRNGLVADPIIRQSFLNNALKPVLQHIAASPNKSRVYGYDIINEPELNMIGYLGGQNLEKSVVRDFVGQCAATIHQYHPEATATVGATQPQWASNWTGLGLDFYEVHYYPHMDEGKPPGSSLLPYADLHLDKPCIVGEFPTEDASYLWSDTGIWSTRWYLETIRSRGYAGALAWSYRVPDTATNWKAAQPVFTQWAQKYGANIGPR